MQKVGTLKRAVFYLEVTLYKYVYVSCTRTNILTHTIFLDTNDSIIVNLIVYFHLYIISK